MYRLLTIAILFVLFSCKKETDLSERIPDSATAVVQVNMPEITNKLLLDKLTGLDFLKDMDLFSEEPEDSAEKEEIEKLLADPSFFGIDVFKKVYGCRTSEGEVNYWTVLFILKDKATFENKLKEAFSADLKHANELSYHFLDNKYLLAWQKDEAFLILPEIPSPVQDQQKVLSAFIRDKKNPAAQEIIKVINSDADISLWIKDFPSYPGMPTGSVSSELWFKDGSLNCTSEISVPGYGDYLSLLSENKLDKEFKGQIPAFTSFYINLSRFALADSTSSIISKAGLTPKLYARALTGRGGAFVSGIKTISREYVSMELDENYELVEKKVVSTETIPAWTVALEVKGRPSALLILENLQKKGLISAENGQYSTIVPPDGKILFKDQFLILTNSPDSTVDIQTVNDIVFSGSPLTLKADIPSLAASMGKYYSMIPQVKKELSEDPVKTIALRIHDLKKEKFSCTLDIQLKDKDKNALLQLLDKLEQKKPAGKSIQ